MELMKESDFRKEIKASPRPGYLFFGEEDYLKSFALKQAREVLSPDPTLSFFNEIRLDALDFAPGKLLDALMPLPMMAERKLVTLTGLNFHTMRESALEELCQVLAQLPDYDYNTLIISAASDCLDGGILPKRPSGTLTALSAHLTPVWFEKTTGVRLAAWIQKHFLHRGVEASPALCNAMIDYCGHNMFVLSGEIDKLCFYLLSHQKAVADEDTMRNICNPATEYDAFAFTNAIMEGNQKEALSILSDYKFRRVDPRIIMGEVIGVVTGMVGVNALLSVGTPAPDIAAALELHEYRVKLFQKSIAKIPTERLTGTLNACVTADAALKLQYTGQGYDVLEKLICGL